MRFDAGPSLQRDLGAGTVAGLGIATFLTVFLHLQRLEAPQDPTLLLLVFGVLLSGPLVVGGLQLLRTELTPAEAIRITGWVLLGSGPLLALTFLLVAFSSAFDAVFGDPYILLPGLVALGGLAGLAFGFHELELRAAKARVQATANRLEAIISGSPIPIVAVDAEGMVTMWNPAATETFKYEPEAVIGKAYPLEPSDLAGEVDRHLEQLRQGADLVGVETTRERADGVRLEVALWTARMVDEDGTFEGAVVLVVDISDRKRREQEVQVLHRVLRHNLRNDLNVIQGNAARVDEALQPLEGLLDRLESRVRADAGVEPSEPTAGTADQSAPVGEAEPVPDSSVADNEPVPDSPVADNEPVPDSSVADIEPAPDPSVADIHSTLLASVPDTVDHTRLMRRKADELVALTEKAQEAEAILRSSEDEHRPVGLGPLVEAPVRDLAVEYPAARIDLDVEDDVQALVNGPIGIAVRELVENAILHAEAEAPVVEVRAFENHDRVHIDICDEGPGIPAEERRVLAEGKESAMLHSSGLGLWLANWLVNRSGGTLAFEDGTAGCTARIEVPVADPDPAAE